MAILAESILDVKASKANSETISSLLIIKQHLYLHLASSSGQTSDLEPASTYLPFAKLMRWGAASDVVVPTIAAR